MIEDVRFPFHIEHSDGSSTTSTRICGRSRNALILHSAGIRIWSCCFEVSDVIEYRRECDEGAYTVRRRRRQWQLPHVDIVSTWRSFMICWYKRMTAEMMGTEKPKKERKASATRRKHIIKIPRDRKGLRVRFLHQLACAWDCSVHPLCVCFGHGNGRVLRSKQTLWPGGAN